MLKCTLARTVFVALFITVASFHISAGKAFADEGMFNVGVAKVDVTPDYPTRLNGYGGRREESGDVAQQLWVKALAISQDDEAPAVIFTIDNLGIRTTMVDKVASDLKRKHDVPRQNVIVTFTHTHCAPKVNGASDNIFGQPLPAEHQKHIDRYTDELTEALIKVGNEAIENRQECTLSWAVGSAGFAANRRTPGGPVDHDVPVLVARDKDKKITAIYTSYACHCTTLSFNKLHGDWAGCAQQTLERMFPGATALVAIGAGSDSNPFPRGQVEHASAHGNELATEVKRLIESDMTPLSAGINTTLESISLPLNDPPTEAELAKTAERTDAVGYNASVQLARLKRGETLTTELDYPIQTLEFKNELTMVFLAGEICVDYSLRLKKELNRDRIWVHGYCNDFVGYIPSERLLREGGYGGGSEIPYFDWPSTLRHGMEQKIIDQVKKQVTKEFHLPAGTQGVPPKSPKDSIRHFKTHDRFRVELVASEPQVNDPVAIDFGPDGSVWVAEMPDYTRRVDEQFKQHGRISRLIDKDEDGFFESSTVFLDGLRFPTDVKVWRKGIIVCDAPDILYFEDSNGDGVADIRKQLFTGFATHNPHARVNSLRIGLDQWLYGSCGLFGGTITSFNGNKVQLGARDFRCNPDLGLIEPVSGNSQQGRVRDDWGNWFGCDNSDLLRHYPWFDRQGANNPLVVPPATRYSLAQNHGLFAPKDLVTFKLTGTAGIATSACGIDVYRDELLGDDLKGDVFSCEPVNQLIHRVKLQRHSATFKGRRAPDETDTEFLVSTDQWFRPVQVRTGPDGALWVVDMYRYVIEHPRWIPQETIKELNTHAGNRLGRIYRIVPKDQALRKANNLESLSTQQLVEHLESANGTTRDLIQQLLVWRSADGTTEPLKKLATEAEKPEVRLQATCILDALNTIDDGVLRMALNDKHESIRQNAVRIFEAKQAGDSFVDELIRLTNDACVPVKMQTAYALATCSSESASDAIAQMLGSETDSFARAAAFNSIHHENISAVFRSYLKAFPVDPTQTDRINTIEQLVKMSGTFGSSEQIEYVLNWLLNQETLQPVNRYTFAGALLTALDRRPAEIKINVGRGHANALAYLFQSATKSLVEYGDDAPATVAAIKLLGRKPGTNSKHLLNRAGVESDSKIVDLLIDLVDPRVQPVIQRTALQALSAIGDSGTPQQLLKCWATASPSIRENMVDCLLSRDQWLSHVLDAIETGKLARSEFPAAKRDRLLSNSNQQIAKRSQAVFAVANEPNNAQNLEQWKDVLALSGDVFRGQAVFKKHCAVCHPTKNQESAVGPDLKAITRPTPQYILEAIVAPNVDVQQQFVQYTALTLDGRTHTGMLVNESASGITLRDKEAKDVVLLRNELEEFKASRLSMMPEGLAKDMDRQQLADVIAAVIEMRKGPKSFPGNNPKIVTAENDGSIKLRAIHAEIYGKEIVFENTAFQNIGYWHGDHDHALWQIDAIEPGKYDVWIDYACHNSVAGNELIVEAGGENVTFQVDGTGQWSEYRKTRIGTIEISPSNTTVVVRPNGPLKTASLIDLRTLLLVPTGNEPNW